MNTPIKWFFAFVTFVHSRIYEKDAPSVSFVNTFTKTQKAIKNATAVWMMKMILPVGQELHILTADQLAIPIQSCNALISESSVKFYLLLQEKRVIHLVSGQKCRISINLLWQNKNWKQGWAKSSSLQLNLQMGTETCWYRRCATCIPNLFQTGKRLQIKQIRDKVLLFVRKCKLKERKYTSSSCLFVLHLYTSYPT